MTRRFKIISFAIALMLGVAVVGVGIYAVSSASAGFSANITFTPSDAKLQILGYIDGLDSSSYSNSSVHAGYFADNYNIADGTTGNYSSTSSLVTYGAWNFGPLKLNSGDFSGKVTRSNFGASDNNGIVPPSDMVIYLQMTNYIGVDVDYTFSYTGNLASNGLAISGEYYLTDLANVKSSAATGFYQTDLTGANAWSTSNVPTAKPTGTVSGTAFTTSTSAQHVVDLTNVHTASKAIMLKITISPITNAEAPAVNFNAGANLADVAFSFTVGATLHNS